MSVGELAVVRRAQEDVVFMGRVKDVHAGRIFAGAALLALLIVVAFTGNAMAALPSADPAPAIATDKADYRPGETVTLHGTGWTPGETVHVSVNDDEGASWSRDVDLTADEFGGIQDRFPLPDWFVAKYRVTATGASGSVATTTFTDGNVSFALATADQAAPANLNWNVAWSQYRSSETCGGTGADGSTAYAGNAVAPNQSEPAVGNGQSAKPTGVTAAGYTLA